MKKIIAAFVLILFLSPSVWGACTGSSPNWSSTRDLDSVNTCISNAQNGDTITVEEGSATWGSRTTFTKPITLQGSGTHGTIITLSYSTDTGLGAIGITAHASLNTIITNFDFRGGGYLIDVNGAYNNTSRVRIHNNKLSTTSYGAIQWYDNQPGLIDNNYFSITSGNKELIHSWGADSDESASWSRASNLGSDEMLVVENNRFYTSAGSNPEFSALTSFEGARWTFRYNDLINAYIDAHPGAYPDEVWSHAWAGRQWEIYGNHWDSTIYALGDLKGGTGVIYNNTSDHGDDIDIYAVTMEIAPCCCKSDLTTTECIQRVGFGQNRALEPMYFWSNANMGLGIGSQEANDCDSPCGASQGPADALRQDTEYYLSQKVGYSSLDCPHPLTGLTGSCSGSPSTPPTLYGRSGYNIASSDAPVLTSPVDNAVAGWPVVFTWEVYSGAVLYHIQADDDDAFGSPAIDDDEVDPDAACDESSCTYTVQYGGALAANTHYYWRVRALR